MLSHLRFHRRGHSNPTSPNPDQPPSPSFAGAVSPYASDNLSPYDGRPPSSGSSTLPPTLPPITRVTSADPDLLSGRLNDISMATSPEPRSPQPPRSPYNNDSGFIGGVALRNYRRDLEAQAAGRYQSLDSMAGAPSDGQQSQHPSRPPLIIAESPTTVTANGPRNVKPASFTAPSKSQNTGPAPVGRRPAGTRLATEPPPVLPNAGAVEPPKGKRNLPFLKNPMSGLLLRRKNNQNVPDLLPLPLGTGREEPVYDPRIRGTRVHDFSAPRSKKNITQNNPNLSGFSSKSKQSGTEKTAEKTRVNLPSELVNEGRNAIPPTDTPRLTSSTSEPNQVASVLKATNSLTQSSSMPLQRMTSIGSEATLETREAGPPVPPKDDTPTSSLNSSRRSRMTSQDMSVTPRTNASIRTTRSKTASLSETPNRDTISSIPKHMKSTSSRFSFDMIGAAKQEKLLEERHRQRYLEKGVEDEPGPRDSRYDDFDEDAFDYDAMMDDDGFEERIPGVNADYEEDDGFEEDIPGINAPYEEYDGFEENIPGVNIDGEEDRYSFDDDSNNPNNDQQNFAGFVFSRSNPASSLASPRSAGLMGTPRDAEGRVIGFAMTQESPRSAGMPLSAGLQPSPLFQESNMGNSGLGIQGLAFAPASQPHNDAPQEAAANLSSRPPQAEPGDDLYFNDGMVGFEDEFAEDLAASPEWDTAPFDESIFDNNDTDKYGRPIPGAFAQAQSLRQAARQDDAKRDSDMTSRLSGRSAASHSTAHTSLSADGYNKSRDDDRGSIGSVTSAEVAVPEAMESQNHSVAVYQAALAAAAHEAAASGKFQRQSSPPREEDVVSRSEELAALPANIQEPELEEQLEDEGFDAYSYDDMDDYELDDDAIIAEANASALANDSDGWYGQEFGFYANPINQPHAQHNSGSSSYEYSNGGFFGPKGMPNLARTMSGRMISREPNLTPITERSEYSNRNSIMSNLGAPGFGTGTPIQSPGLAQLAMMAERGDDQMSLSALMRLRSKAWGGSQASLSSSREGSPRSEYSPWGASGLQAGGHMRKNSVFSTMSRDSETGSMAGSPTLTMAMPYLSSPPLPMPGQGDYNVNPRNSLRNSLLSETSHAPQPLEIEIPPHTERHDGPLSALSAVSEVSSSECTNTATVSPRRPGMGHRHKGSADSISYMKEEDSGETRWVMERRRTAESGEVEILERGVVEGGRI